MSKKKSSLRAPATALATKPTPSTYNAKPSGLGALAVTPCPAPADRSAGPTFFFAGGSGSFFLRVTNPPPPLTLEGGWGMQGLAGVRIERWCPPMVQTPSWMVGCLYLLRADNCRWWGASTYSGLTICRWWGASTYSGLTIVSPLQPPPRGYRQPGGRATPPHL